MEGETLLDDVVHSSVDFKGAPAIRSKSGCWRSASFVIAVEMAERFAYFGISLNLISYLTGPLGQSTAAAAANVNAWTGTALLTPFLGAFIADSFLGRYWTVIIASLLYILGLGFLSLSAAFISSQRRRAVDKTACYPSQLQIMFFFFSLYLIALAQGGHKPCLQAFGADQFDEEDNEELKSKNSFFNWWNVYLCVSILIGLFVLSYVQENLSWELGFGIPCIVMCFAIIVFLFGSITYRFSIRSDDKNPFVRICRVFVKAASNWRASQAVASHQVLPHERAHFRFLDRALLEPNDQEVKEKACSTNDIEDAKAILMLLPISLTCLPYAIVYSQSSTLFTKQGVTMDRYISTSFQIPAAALQSCIAASMVFFIPFYDRVLVPFSRTISRNHSGISMLQRIGTGIILCIISMTIAGFIERKRLAIAFQRGLVDLPMATVPMTVWWLIPQYVVLGISESFALVGLQEFFYDQVPRELKSVGLALCWSITGLGNFLSSFLISVINKATSNGHGEESWFSNNLNRAHLDYFYWLLLGSMQFHLHCMFTLLGYMFIEEESK